jgi:cytoskeletal protein RodZ
MPKKNPSSKRKVLSRESSLPIIFILMAIIAVIVWVNIQRTHEFTYTPTQLETSVNSSTLQIPDTNFTVTLKDGKAEYSDSDMQGNVSLSNPYFSIETSDGYDTFSTMNYTTGGSGEFIAIALFHTIENSTVFANTYTIGDRIKVENIEKISGDKDVYEIKVDYLDREENAPMATDPTIKKSVTLKVDTHKIVSQPQE